MKQSLEAPYSGPREVVSFNRELKTAQIKVNGLIQTVSIQRLKPCKLALAVKKLKRAMNQKFLQKRAKLTTMLRHNQLYKSAIVFEVSHTIKQCSNVVTKIASLNGFIEIVLA